MCIDFAHTNTIPAQHFFTQPSNGLPPHWGTTSRVHDLTARCLLNLISNHVSFPQSAPVLLDFLMFLENNKLVPTSGPLHSCSHGFEYSAPGYWQDSLLQGLFRKGNYPENFSQTICLSNHLFSHLNLLLDLSFHYNIIFINTNTEFIVCLPKWNMSSTSMCGERHLSSQVIRPRYRRHLLHEYLSDEGMWSALA